MKSLTPAHDENEARKKREEIELCGKNRGPHQYIPIEWMYSEWMQSTGEKKQSTYKRVTRFLCTVCFNNINTSSLIGMYKDLSLPENRGIS